MMFETLCPCQQPIADKESHVDLRLEFGRFVAATLAAVFSLASRREIVFFPVLAATTPPALAAAAFSLIGRRHLRLLTLYYKLFVFNDFQNEMTGFV
jgi:hypothetical protein